MKIEEALSSWYNFGAKTFSSFPVNYNNSKQNMLNGCHHVSKMNCLLLLLVYLLSFVIFVYTSCIMDCSWIF